MKTILLVFSVLFLTSGLMAQDVMKDLNPEVSIPQMQVGTDVANPFLVQTQNDLLIGQINTLSTQLNAAREQGNVALILSLQAQINNLTGVKPVDNSNIQAPMPVLGEINPGNETDAIGVTTVSVGDIWAEATTTQTNGRVWIASTHWASGVGDTLRVFYSDNGGISWTQFTSFNFAGNDVDFRTDELDIEVLNDGTSWWIYVVGALDFNGLASSFVAKWKGDGTGYNFQYLPKPTGTNQFWPRVVSDYPRFTSAAYIYIVASLDSQITGPTKRMVTRGFSIQDPFAAAPTILDRNNNVIGSYAWQTNAAPDSAYIRSDIAYQDSLTQGDQIITCTLFENWTGSIGQTMYMSYSNDYMATTPTILLTSDLTYQSFRPVMSFSGGNDQIKGVITFVRKFVNGSDWDPRFASTVNGGATWVQGYLESTTDTTYKSDVIGLRGIDGNFRFGWINRDAPNTEFLYRAGYLTTSLQLTSIVNMDIPGFLYPNPTWGGRAGYTLTGDSCLAVYGSSNITENVYAISGCSGAPTNIHNSEIPVTYSLSQNYPNPFNPSTSIKFEIPRDGFVKVVVYDLLGKEVATLVNDKRTAGSYIVDFNAGGLSSGVYFYKLITNEFTDIKKMTLIK